MNRACAPLLVLVAALAGACTQVSGDPNAVVAIAFDALPYPALVSGDTLRDETGAVRALHASALNSDGADISSASVSFLALDTGIVISPTGVVTSTNTTTTSARILAQAGTLQSRPLTLMLTPRPDSIAQGASVDTLHSVIPDATANTSSAITVKVLSNGATPATPARGWVVRFTVEYRGAEVAANNTTLAWLVDESNRRSAEDTTGADGLASRRLRVISTAPPPFDASGDSLVVIARAVARGRDLAGAPVRIVVRVFPR